MGIARCRITVMRKMNSKDYAGKLQCDGEIIVYQSPLRSWSVPITDVRLIGEYTNSDGPHIDDYFLVFLTAPDNGWHEASFYAKGRDVALAALIRRIGDNLECGLFGSTEYKTRIMWPPHLKGQELMEVIPPKKQGLWHSLMNFGTSDIRLSAAARQAFKIE